MFYLGGLTLGYLTPYPVGADVPQPAVAPATKAKPSIQLFDKKADTGRDEGDDRPILWPWHIFY